jgi:predicted SAM-dependent methyltransferase
MEKTIVNFGCGKYAPKGYLNIDGSLTVRLAYLPLPFGSRKAYVRTIRAGHVRYGTARGLRFREATLDGVYASHVLEHIVREDCVELLRRIRGWLKSTGLLRVVLPDLGILVEKYRTGRIDANQFVEKLHLSTDGMSLLQVALGRAYHRWMYDVESFTSILTSLGYTGIRQCVCGQSALEEFANLDREIDKASQSFYIEAAPGSSPPGGARPNSSIGS